MVAMHQSLAEGTIAHAFGGALALAWCTRQARGTIDLDINLFVDPRRASEAIAALPREVSVDESDQVLLERDGQARLWWDRTPVDVFLNTTMFHEEVATRVRWEPFAGQELPFLSCQDLAVFKAFFNRTRDWADLEAMRDAGSLDVQAVAAVLIGFLGTDDDRVDRLLDLSDGSG
jgi:hypothetical protein